MPVLIGSAIAPGAARGPAFVHASEVLHLDADPDPAGRQDSQHRRIRTAMDDVQASLETDARHMTGALGTDSGDIFRAQSAMMGEASILTALTRQIDGEHDAESAVFSVFTGLADRLRSTGNAATCERGDDIDDLARRMLLSLRGIHAHRLERMPTGSVLVANRLYPSDTVFLSRRSTAAVVAEFAGAASHATLLAREMGVPCVGGIPCLLELVHGGDDLIVDGTRGHLLHLPSPAEAEGMAGRLIAPALSAPCLSPLRTATGDGEAVLLQANARNREDVELAIRSGAEGIGLFRVEPFFLASKHLPTVEEFRDFLADCLEPARGLRANIRLLDIGADKNLPYLPLPYETDPFLGLRGIRVLLRFPELLIAQLRAILDLSRHHDIGILLPMVTLASDVERVAAACRSVAETMGLRRLPPIGVMIETPAAALTVPELLPHVDFLSIGSNDLTQYTMAAGRESSSVHEYFQDDHPAVLRLIARTISDAGRRPVSLCGEIAGRTAAIPALLRTGLRAFSVAASLLGAVRQTIGASHG